LKKKRKRSLTTIQYDWFADLGTGNGIARSPAARLALEIGGILPRLPTVALLSEIGVAILGM